jgi:cytochrome P450
MDAGTQAGAADALLAPMLAAGPGVVAPAADVRALPGPPSHWLFGSTRHVKRERVHEAIESWVDRYGPFLGCTLGRRRYVVIADSTLIHAILRCRPELFARGRRLSEIIQETAPPGLFTAEGEHWRRQRKLVMRALTPEAVRGFFPHIQRVTERLQQRWAAAADRGEPCDVTRDLKCFAVDIAAGLAIGEDVDTLRNPDDPFQSDIEFWFWLVGHRLGYPVPYWHWFALAPERRLREVQARRDRLLARVIGQARQRLEADPERRTHPASILEALIAARDAPGSEFTDEDVKGNVLAVLFAGEDTVANAIAWLLLHLATDAQLAYTARIEADGVLASEGRIGDFEALGRLRYLESIALESMRIRTVAPILGVTARAAVNLAGLHVEPGQTLILALRAASRRSGSFDPFDAIEAQRWMAAAGDGEQPGSDPRRDAFPFGAGPRLCPGRYLAMVEIKMAVSMALRSFDFAVQGDPADSSERYTFTMGPSSLRMLIARRTQVSVPPPWPERAAAARDAVV